MKRTITTLLIICTTLIIAQKPQPAELVQPLKIDTIIVAWCSIFEPDESDIERRVKKRLGLLRSIGLLFKGIPNSEEVKDHLFSILNEIPVTKNPIDPKIWKTNYPSWETDYQLPPIFEQHLLTDALEEEQAVYQKVSRYIQEQAEIPSGSRKRILQGVADFIFQSHDMNTAMEPVPHMVDLLKTLKKQGYRVILNANTPGYAWDQFLDKFKKAQVIEELFPQSHQFISGKEKALKTSKKMYEKIIQQHHLNPTQCLVIECHAKNLTYPLKRKMSGLVFNPKTTDFEVFEQELHSKLA